MREVDNFLHKESAKLYQLLRDVKENRNLQDKVWDDFCKKSNDEKPKKSYFRRHPKHISSSSSEVFSPRRHEGSKSTRPKPLKARHNWKSEDSGGGDNLPSQGSLDIVTVRRELNAFKDSSGKKSLKGFAAYNEEKPSENLRKGSMRAKSSEVAKVLPKKQQSAPNSARKVISPKIGEKMEKCSNLITDIHVEAKLKHILEKALNCMEDIRAQIDAGASYPDGDEDMDRRKKRSVEFASRFSRNYLYQLNRQVNEIMKLTKNSPGNLSNRTSSSVRQKLVGSYQTLLQGLQAYYNHLPISITTAVPDKVRELLKLTASLCDIHRSCASMDLNSNLEKENVIDVFEVRSRCLLEKINEHYFCASTVSLLQSNSMMEYCPQFKVETHKHKKKKEAKGRYAMYAMAPTRKDAHWKKAVAALAKKKFNVSSKYKTANFKHRPPVEKQLPPQKQTVKGVKIMEKKSSDNIKQKKSVLNDDSIQTMIQLQTDKDSESINSNSQLMTHNVASRQSCDTNAKGDMLATLVEKVVHTIREEHKDVNHDQVKNILQGFLEYVGGSQEKEDDKKTTAEKNEISTEDRKQAEEETREGAGEDDEKPKSIPEFENNNILEKVVDVIRRNEESLRKAKEVVRECQQNVGEVQEKKKKERKKSVTVSGSRNAQLICIKDEDSLIEPPSVDDESIKHEVKRKRSKHHRTAKSEETRHNNSEVLLTSSDRVSKIKISRLPRGPTRPLKMLPKQYALDVLEYKVNYGKARKGNHMYRKSVVKQPWILMGEIADKILDELIEGVGLEIQINDVIDKIYASEFAE